MGMFISFWRQSTVTGQSPSDSQDLLLSETTESSGECLGMVNGARLFETADASSSVAKSRTAKEDKRTTGLEEEVRIARCTKPRHLRLVDRKNMRLMVNLMLVTIGVVGYCQTNVLGCFAWDFFQHINKMLG